MSKDPLHGVTLNMMLVELEQAYGWVELAKRIRINCFASDPSIKSSLKFLRRTPWARAKVEALYVEFKVGAKPKPRSGVKYSVPSKTPRANSDATPIWPELKK